MRIAAELGLLLAIGVFLGVLGPYGTAQEPAPAKYVFWLVSIIGGGLIGHAVETALRRWIAHEWQRVIATASAITLPVALLVFGAMIVVLGHEHHLVSAVFLHLLWQVFAISLAVMAVRALVWRQPERIVETRTIVAAPLPHAEAKLRSRLSAKRRTARLLAIEAQDHYVQVHTDAGAELIGLRFSDAVAELAGAHGFRVHRSWWVSAEAIRTARWRRGSGEVELENGLTVPVSRSAAPDLRRAGWL
jgi:DNA-binding LytR/AlgR family response regulator